MQPRQRPNCLRSVILHHPQAGLARRSRHRRVDRLFDDLEPAVIEGQPGSLLHLDDALANSALLQLQRAEMTIWIISGAAEQGMSRPGAACATIVGVIAGPAE